MPQNMFFRYNGMTNVPFFAALDYKIPCTSYNTAHSIKSGVPLDFRHTAHVGDINFGSP